MTRIGLYRFYSRSCKNTYWLFLTDDMLYFEHKNTNQAGAELGKKYVRASKKLGERLIEVL